MKCKICSSISDIFATARLLNKYSIKYFRCRHCGFIQTEEPFWLAESHSNAINNYDIGIISRNIKNAMISKAIISFFFNSRSKYIDYGGGYGIYVRLMRDYGFNFYRLDYYCQNLFAKGFEFEEHDSETYELLTAFEVFEHFPDPLKNLMELLRFSSNIIFTTELVPASQPKPEHWWYYGIDHGQHVSFYTLTSLKLIAKHYNLNFFSNKRNFHLFTKKNIAPTLFNLLCKIEISTILNVFKRRPSLLQSDFEALTGTRLK